MCQRVLSPEDEVVVLIFVLSLDTATTHINLNYMDDFQNYIALTRPISNIYPLQFIYQLQVLLM